MPQELQIFRLFDKVISDCLNDVIRRTEQFVLDTPLSNVAGPSEGGHLADNLHSAAQVGCCRQIFAAWNAQGAFGRSADDTLNVDRMLHFAAQLSHVGATIAVLAEPKLSSHATWPVCTGFRFFGSQTDQPASVAVLVHEAVTHAVSIIEGYGNECAMWVAIQG